VSWKNVKLLQAVRELPCCRCGTSDGTVVAAHSNQIRDGKGKGIKSHDYRIAALCHVCHMELDQGNNLTKQEKTRRMGSRTSRNDGTYFSHRNS
jgi:hypothetical protein